MRWKICIRKVNGGGPRQESQGTTNAGSTRSILQKIQVPDPFHIIMAAPTKAIPTLNNPIAAGWLVETAPFFVALVEEADPADAVAVTVAEATPDG